MTKAVLGAAVPKGATLAAGEFKLRFAIGDNKVIYQSVPGPGGTGFTWLEIDADRFCGVNLTGRLLQAGEVVTITI